MNEMSHEFVLECADRRMGEQWHAPSVGRVGDDIASDGLRSLGSHAGAVGLRSDLDIS